MDRKTFSDELEGTQPNSRWDRDLVTLCRAVYTDPGAMQLPPGWRELPQDEYPRGVADVARSRSGDATLNDNESKFRARIYAHREPGQHERYAVAFRGTVPAEGVAEAVSVNLGQGVGLKTEQYKHAERLSKVVFGAWGRNVVFTGHSLGGGLAAMASVTTGCAAVDVNPAALHDNSMQRVLQSRGLKPADFRRAAEQGRVRVYSVEGDFLTSNKLSALQGKPPGAIIRQQHYMEPSLANQFKLHSVERSLSSMDRQRGSAFTLPHLRDEALRDLAASSSGEVTPTSVRRTLAFNAVERNLADMKETSSGMFHRVVNALAHDEVPRQPGQPLAERGNINPSQHPERIASTQTQETIKQMARTQLDELAEAERRHMPVQRRPSNDAGSRKR